MAAKIKDIMKALEQLAPLETCLPGDNCGLMFGQEDAQAETVLLAVDANLLTVAQAIETGAELIVAHHPLFYEPVKTLRGDRPIGALAEAVIKSGIGIYCAHTNFDACEIGTSRALAMAAGIRQPLQRGFLASGELSQTTAAELGKRLGENLPSGYVNVFGQGKVRSAVFCAGSGNGELEEVLKLKPDVFVCGELKYHQICEYLEYGIPVVTCGHRESEAAALKELSEYLQNHNDLLQYNIRYLVADGRYGGGTV